MFEVESCVLEIASFESGLGLNERLFLLTGRDALAAEDSRGSTSPPPCRFPHTGTSAATDCIRISVLLRLFFPRSSAEFSALFFVLLPADDAPADDALATALVEFMVDVSFHCT